MNCLETLQNLSHFWIKKNFQYLCITYQENHPLCLENNVLILDGI